tara:strand:- start:739 stop:1047 length:309 start_codon:yes stop_codon:yes gene_type:complete
MDKRPIIHPEYISNKNKKVFFDKSYCEIIDGISEYDTTFVVRVQGKIIEEVDNQFKIKTHNWLYNYGHTIIKYPKNDLVRQHLDLQIIGEYLVDKDKVTFLK